MALKHVRRKTKACKSSRLVPAKTLGCAPPLPAFPGGGGPGRAVPPGSPCQEVRAGWAAVTQRDTSDYRLGSPVNSSQRQLSLERPPFLWLWLHAHDSLKRLSLWEFSRDSDESSAPTSFSSTTLSRSSHAASRYACVTASQSFLSSPCARTRFRVW